MIDITPQILRRLSEHDITAIPESSIDSTTKAPCVTYQEKNNIDNLVGDTLGYSDVSYQFDVWDRDRTHLIQQCKNIDKVMKTYHFERTMFEEQKHDGIIRKIMSYKSTIKEDFE